MRHRPLPRTARRRPAARLALALTALGALAAPAPALAGDGWTLTGTAMRSKSIAFVDVDVYEISHFMQAVPAEHTRKAVIDAEVGKKFVWTLQRDVEREKIVDALRAGFEMNGYKEKAKVERFVGAFTKDLKHGLHVTISYDPAAHATKIDEEGGGSATVDGSDFMRATWSVWFGKIDPPKLGDALLAKLE